MTTIIEFEIEESLLERLDETAAQVGLSRTVLITTAIKHTLRYCQLKNHERDEIGYRLWPPGDDEVDSWSELQDWGDPWDGPDDSRLN
jgi:hypothetical protein